MDNFQDSLNRFKIPIALSLIGLVLIIGGYASTKLAQESASTPTFPKESLVQNQATPEITVDVSGAVLKPGVYKLNSNSRVEDAIKAAGGFTQTASGEYVSKYLNLAQKVSDGAKIYIPISGEQYTAQVSTVGSVAGAQTSQINLNTATQSELESLPGIGPVTASKIINERPFSKVEELQEKKIISKATFEKIKNLVTLF